MTVSAWPLTIKRQHVGLLHFVWTDLVPLAFCAITPEDAKQAWELFAQNPADPKLKNAKRIANEIWLVYVQGN